ncbi:MAG: 2-dehydro-3-deoxyglucarate aldolase [Verrucomicrobia bacterium]|nr:2-dehydro-3-deoxyglucarate aldolase [Verrucomicrobiota bacterium]
MNPHPLPSLGTWLSIGSPAIAELAALSGFHWLLLDLEHGCASESAIPDQLRALRGTPAQGIVRVGAPHPDLVARLLDWGAHGLMFPHVEDPDQARQIVATTRHTPRGHRGVSRTVRASEYGLKNLAAESGDPIVMAQIETARGVRHAPEIARVDGIDVLFVGPADLQFDLANGLSRDNPPGDFAHCLSSVVQAATMAGKEAGILLRDPADLSFHLDLGFTRIALDSDLAILRKAYLQSLARIPS